MLASARTVFHYTDSDSFKAIVAQSTWVFRANQPPGEHPNGAYFTTLRPDVPKLAQRLRIPRAKLEHVFAFRDVGDLIPLPGNRGEFVIYSPDDYAVERSRQQFAGKAVQHVERT